MGRKSNIIYCQYKHDSMLLLLLVSIHICMFFNHEYVCSSPRSPNIQLVRIACEPRTASTPNEPRKSILAKVNCGRNKRHLQSSSVFALSADVVFRLAPRQQICRRTSLSLCLVPHPSARGGIIRIVSVRAAILLPGIT